MNKRVYLRDDEVPIWERARELAGDKLSPVIVSALKSFVAQKESEPKGFERIEVRFADSDDHDIPKAKAFYGKWIFPPTKPVITHNEDCDETHRYAVALTAKGGVVVYCWFEDSEAIWRGRFLVYPSLEAAATDSTVNWPIRQTMERIGVPVGIPVKLNAHSEGKPNGIPG